MATQAADAALDCLTIPQVAELTKLAEEMVRRAIRSGDLRASNLGKLAYRIRRVDVDAWLEKTVVRPDVPTAVEPRRNTGSYAGPKRLDW